MRKIYTVGLVVISVCSVFAIVASTAFAASEWLFNMGTVSTGLPVETSGEIILSDDGTGTEILCDGIFVGTVKEKSDEITRITNLSLVEESTTNLSGTTVVAINCSVVKAGLCSVAVGALIWVIPVNLPWKTEIELDEAVFVDRILNGGKGIPGYEISCPTIIGVQTDVCTGEPGAVLTNGVGDVINEFLNEELTNPDGNCTIGGVKQALVVSEGPGLTEDTEAGTLAIS